ncbi:MAG: hypothetical protein AB1546_14955 [bacterium]
MKRKRALLGSNPPRDNLVGAHQSDGSGARQEGIFLAFSSPAYYMQGQAPESHRMIDPANASKNPRPKGENDMQFM